MKIKGKGEDVLIIGRPGSVGAGGYLRKNLRELTKFHELCQELGTNISEVDFTHKSPKLTKAPLLNLIENFLESGYSRHIIYFSGHGLSNGDWMSDPVSQHPEMERLIKWANDLNLGINTASVKTIKDKIARSKSSEKVIASTQNQALINLLEYEGMKNEKEFGDIFEAKRGELTLSELANLMKDPPHDISVEQFIHEMFLTLLSKVTREEVSELFTGGLSLSHRDLKRRLMDSRKPISIEDICSLLKGGSFLFIIADSCHSGEWISRMQKISLEDKWVQILCPGGKEVIDQQAFTNSYYFQLRPHLSKSWFWSSYYSDEHLKKLPKEMMWPEPKVEEAKGGIPIKVENQGKKEFSDQMNLMKRVPLEDVEIEAKKGLWERFMLYYFNKKSLHIPISDPQTWF